MRVNSQLLNAQLEILSSDPTPGTKGRVFYNDIKNLVSVDTGSGFLTEKNKMYDYIVKENDSEALVDALTNNGNNYASIFISGGTYYINGSIILGDYVRYVCGDNSTIIYFNSSNNSYAIKSNTQSDVIIFNNLQIYGVDRDICFYTSETVTNKLMIRYCRLYGFRTIAHCKSVTYSDTIQCENLYIRHIHGDDENGTIHAMFMYCNNINNCYIVADALTSPHTGFYYCNYISNIQYYLFSDNLSYSHNNTLFSNCNFIDNISSYRIGAIDLVDAITVNFNVFYSCKYLSNIHHYWTSYVRDTFNNAGLNFNFYVFNQCTNISSSDINLDPNEFNVTSVNSLNIYLIYNCSRISGCHTYDSRFYNSANFKHLKSNSNITNHRASTGSAGNVVGYEDNIYITACYHSGVNNSGNTFTGANSF